MLRITIDQSPPSRAENVWVGQLYTIISLRYYTINLLENTSCEAKNNRH